ncbi:MAG: hypothetical protein EON58_09050 [Alphaproteobacteria bacterium]|nr:MAG: hypothetical protein EON58_09050 [Alphaproteobacteria bacterium]
MTLLNLQAKQDHLEKAARTRDPIKAIAEFVWNSLDADATKVEVLFEKNELGSIDRISIRDNGCGISEKHARSDFGNLGASWKRNGGRTPVRHRPVHGKEGRGRLRFFSLAERCRWNSVYVEEGMPLGLTIEIAAQALETCSVSDPVASSQQEPGTVVTLSNLKLGLDRLDTKADFLEFSTIFAPYLLKYKDVEIRMGARRVDPSEIISQSFDFPLRPIVTPNRTIKDLQLKVIEWNSHVEGRKIHLGAEDGIVLGSQAANVTAPGFEFSAYANSAFFQEMADGNLLELEDLSDPDLTSVMGDLRDRLGDYFRRRQTERAKGLIEELKESGAYPYEGDPKDTIEAHERQIFDIATYAVSSYSKEFKKADTSLKRMTLTLLREALRHNPDSLTSILQAVVKLPRGAQDEFAGLLKKTELANIIAASSMIADRVAVLETLKAALFDPTHRPKVKERGGLDEIVKDNTWLFGERFHITLPEAGLTKVLNRVADDQGKLRSGKVQTPSGKTGRVDCFLGRSVPHPDQEKKEYVVVELKRPTVCAGRKELAQIEDYASALTGDMEFRGTDTFWNFYLLTTEHSADILSRVNQKDRPTGLVSDQDGCRIWVRTWAELIRECEGRLHFIQDRLRIEISADDIEARIAALKRTILKDEEIT